MLKNKKITTSKVKPFPVFLLLDVSGSMDVVIDPENTRETGQTIFDDGQEWDLVEGGTSKIQLLNDAVKKMITSFTEEENMDTEFLISIITFGDKAKLHLSPTRASEVSLQEFQTQGETAMGAALKLAKEQIENKEIVPSRAYRPTVVLVSDGVPNDDWEPAMHAFINQGRSSKCFCMAMGVGDDADKSVLAKFIENTPELAQQGDTKIPNKVFFSDDAESLHRFFQRVTMSVMTHTKSKNLNVVPASSRIKLDGGSVKDDSEDSLRGSNGFM